MQPVPPGSEKGSGLGSGSGSGSARPHPQHGRAPGTFSPFSASSWSPAGDASSVQIRQQQRQHSSSQPAALSSATSREQQPPALRVQDLDTASSGASPAAVRAASVASISSSIPHGSRTQQQQQQFQQAGPPPPPSATPIYQQFATSHVNSNNSNNNLNNNISASVSSANAAFNNARPTPATRTTTTNTATNKGHARKHAAAKPGMFDSTLPSTSTSNLSLVGMNGGQYGGHGGNGGNGGNGGGPGGSSTLSVLSTSAHTHQLPTAASAGLSSSLTASHIAAQAAVASHQPHQYNNASAFGFHSRQRSSTVPFPGEYEPSTTTTTTRRGSGSKVHHVNPPMLSLTEASTPRESGFPSSGGGGGGGGSGGGPPFSHERNLSANSTSTLHSSLHSPAATAAANVVFPRSGQNSPTTRDSSTREPSSSFSSFSSAQPPAQPPPPSALASSAATTTEKLLSKSEKAKAKLFSRPGKIGTKGDVKEKPLPSPGKIGSALSALQRTNVSAGSLVDPATGQHLYSMSNSSSTTIRPFEPGGGEEKGKEKEKEKEKEKKHHFLSRQKQKLREDYHLPLSSAASNSRPTDPNAPSSLYNFSVPPSPAPHSSTFAKSKKDKKHGDHRGDGRPDHGDSPFGQEWPGSSSLPALSQIPTNLSDAMDMGKSAAAAANSLSMEDAWPYLKAKLLVIFTGEDLRLPIEDINRVVQNHIQWCVHRRSPNAMLDDLRDFLAMGFSTLDRTLRLTPEDRFMPTLVELWLFTFTSVLPYMQAAFLPLDLEVAGCGTIMTAEHSREFWGGVVTTSPPTPVDNNKVPVMPAASVLDVRRLVLTAYRDIVILPRYDSLKTIFSRLSLEFLPSAFSNMALASPTTTENGNGNGNGHGIGMPSSTSPSESFSAVPRPGTALSMNPSIASCASTSTTLLSESSAESRSRAVSNVSIGSRGSDGAAAASSSYHRPFTPSGVQILSSVREQNVEDSKQVIDMVGRMLQCMSVLSSLGGVGGDAGDDEGNRRMVELCKMLKLNWLGRGRTGRNRMGIVGGRVRREDVREELRVA